MNVLKVQRSIEIDILKRCTQEIFYMYVSEVTQGERS